MEAEEEDSDMVVVVEKDEGAGAEDYEGGVKELRGVGVLGRF